MGFETKVTLLAIEPYVNQAIPNEFASIAKWAVVGG